MCNRKKIAEWRKSYLANRFSNVPIFGRSPTTSRCCVLYLKNGKEFSSPWLSRTNAETAYQLLKARYGKAIIYVD